MLEVESMTSVSAHGGWDGVERRSNTPLRETLKPLEALGGREQIVELLGQARNLARPSSMEVKHLDNVGDIHLSAAQAANQANNSQLKR